MVCKMSWSTLLTGFCLCLSTLEGLPLGGGTAEASQPLLHIQVLDGTDSQYPGMQVGPTPDEDEDAAAVLPDEDTEAFRNSSIGMLTLGGVPKSPTHD